MTVWNSWSYTASAVKSGASPPTSGSCAGHQALCCEVIEPLIGQPRDAVEGGIHKNRLMSSLILISSERATAAANIRYDMCFWCDVVPCSLLDSGRQLSSAQYGDCIHVLSMPCLVRKGRGLSGQPVRAWQCCAACTAVQQPGVRPTPTPASEQPWCFPMQLTKQTEYVAGLYLLEPGIDQRMAWPRPPHCTGFRSYLLRDLSTPIFAGIHRVQPHPQKLSGSGQTKAEHIW